jgi:hypothetical protein
MLRPPLVMVPKQLLPSVSSSGLATMVLDSLTVPPA